VIFLLKVLCVVSKALNLMQNENIRPPFVEVPGSVVKIVEKCFSANNESCRPFPEINYSKEIHL
jgi:hypothetical protein